MLQKKSNPNRCTNQVYGGVKPTDIRISQAYRPRDAHGFDISEVPPEALVSNCKNCIKVFLE